MDEGSRKIRGSMQVRTEITVLSADEPRSVSLEDLIVITSSNSVVKNIASRLLGFKCYEKIGIAIVNPRGISQGRKSVKVGE